MGYAGSDVPKMYSVADMNAIVVGFDGECCWFVSVVVVAVVAQHPYATGSVKCLHSRKE